MQTYKELVREGYKLGDNGFCGVITTATITGLSYKRAKTKLEKLGRKPRKGTKPEYYLKVIRGQGYEVKRLDELSRNRYTWNQISQKCPKGKFIVESYGSINHVAALVDGKYIDWTDKSERGKAPKFSAYVVYQVTKI
jgi:hypothetical protein